MAFSMVTLTQAEYDSIPSKDPERLYIISDGADRTLLSAGRPPEIGDGIVGDFFIDTASWLLHGPKGAPDWPVGVSLVGPPGPAGPVGGGAALAQVLALGNTTGGTDIIGGGSDRVRLVGGTAGGRVTVTAAGSASVVGAAGGAAAAGLEATLAGGTGNEAATVPASVVARGGGAAAHGRLRITSDNYDGGSGDVVQSDGAGLAIWGPVPAHIHSGAPLDALSDVVVPSPTSGHVLTWNGTNWVNQAAPPLGVNFLIGDGTAVIPTGLKGWVEVPSAWSNIESARLVADASGSIVVEVWKSAYAAAPPVVAGKISASAPLTLSSAVRAEDTTLTGWTKTGLKGDYLAFNVVSASVVKVVDVSLVLIRA